MAWVVESQAGLEPKAPGTEARAFSLLSGRLRCPLGAPEATKLHRDAGAHMEEVRDYSGFGQPGPVPITGTGLACSGIAGGEGRGDFCLGWGCAEGWHTAP